MQIELAAADVAASQQPESHREGFGTLNMCDACRSACFKQCGLIGRML